LYTIHCFIVSLRTTATVKNTCSILLAVLILAAAPVPSEEVSYTQTLNVVYAEPDGVGLLLDVFTPLPGAGPAKGLGIICVTSGAWKSDRGMVDAHKKFGFFDVLCAHGYTVFAVRPGSLSLFTAEQMLAHVKTGIRFVKDRAADYGIDAGRLGMVGASAGGHLSLLAATCSETGDPAAADPWLRLGTEVAAVGVFCPPTDFLDWNGKKYGLDLMQGQLVFRDGLTGKSEEQIEASAKAISPLHQIKPGLPPFLLIHGDADSLVPTQQSISFAEAVQAQGGAAELIIKPGADHAWPTVREEIEKMACWLDRQFGLSSVTVESPEE
jgi:acetyl esterase/lipase